MPGAMPVTDYRVEAFLGEGGYGCVYKVVNTRTKIPKALKVITLRDTQGYKEYQALALFREIRDPNLVPIENYWLKDEHGREIKFTEDESLNIAGRGVVELLILMGLGDKSLADRLKECYEATGTGIPVDKLMDYMHSIASAIDFLNLPKTVGDRQNVAIQHGDIKPGNVLMVGNGVQVGDYGLAQAISVTPDTGKSRTTSGNAAGTPEYASPEQMGGKASRNSDQYSLAISYYEMRTGKLPFDDQVTRWACLVPDGLDFGLVPEAEQEVLHKATSRQFAQRYPSCVDFVRALRRVHDSIPVPTEASKSRKTPMDIPRLTPISRPIVDRLKPGSTDFVPGIQLVDRLGIENEEELWRVYDVQEKQYALLKIIRGTNPSRAFDEYNLLYKLQNIKYERILNVQRLWVVDQHGKEYASEKIQQPNMLVDKYVLVLIEAVEKTLEDHIGDLKQNTNVERLKRKWYDIISNLRFGADYWNDYCGQGYCDLNPASILVNQYDQVKIDSARIAKFLRKGGSQSSQLAESFSFRAPELYDTGHTKQSDQYSLAMIYFWLSTGETVFPPNYRPADIKAYLDNSCLDFSNELPDEAPVLTQATLLYPEQRFPDSVAFIEAFHVALKYTDIRSFDPEKVKEGIKKKEEQAGRTSSGSRNEEVVPVQTSEPMTRLAEVPIDGTIQFPMLSDEDLAQYQLERVTKPAQPPTTQKGWNGKPTAKDEKKTEVDKKKTEVEKKKTFVEPVKEETGGLNLDDDVDEKKRSPWPFRIVLILVLLGAFAGTLYVVYSGPIHPTVLVSTPPEPPDYSVFSKASLAANDDGYEILDPRSPEVPLQRKWEDDYKVLRQKLQESKEIDKIPGLLKDYREFHQANPIAIQLLDKIDVFAASALKINKCLADKQPVSELNSSLEAYIRAKEQLGSDVSSDLKDTYSGIESQLVKHARSMIENVSKDTLWTENAQFFEMVQINANVDDSTKALIETGMLECALMKKDKDTKPLKPIEGDAYRQYVSAIQTTLQSKPDYRNAVGLLRKALPKPNEPEKILKDRIDNIAAILNNSLVSFKANRSGFANYSDKLAAADALQILLALPALGKGENNASRYIMEVASLLAEAKDKSCVTWYQRIDTNQLMTSQLSEEEKVNYALQQSKSFKKYSTKQDELVSAYLAALTVIDAYQTNLQAEEIAEWIINPCLEIKKETQGDANAYKKLGLAMFKYHNIMLDKMTQWSNYCADKNRNCNEYLLDIAKFCVEMDGSNEQAATYAIFHEFNVIDPRWTYADKRFKDVREKWQSFINKSNGTSNNGLLIKHLQSRIHLRNALDIAPDDSMANERDRLLKLSLSLADTTIDSLHKDNTPSYVQIIISEYVAYIYNSVCNHTNDKAFRTKYYDKAIQICNATKIKYSDIPPYLASRIWHTIGITQEDKGFYLADLNSYEESVKAYDYASNGKTEISDKIALDKSRCCYRFAKSMKINLEAFFITMNSNDYFVKCIIEKSTRDRMQHISASSISLSSLINSDSTDSHIKIEAMIFLSKIDYDTYANDKSDSLNINTVRQLYETIMLLANALSLCEKCGGYQEKSVYNDFVVKSCIFYSRYCNSRDAKNYILNREGADYRKYVLYHDKIRDSVTAHTKSMQSKNKLKNSASLLKSVQDIYNSDTKFANFIQRDGRASVTESFVSACESQSEDIRKISSSVYFSFASDIYTLPGAIDTPDYKQTYDYYASSAKKMYDVYISLMETDSASIYDDLLLCIIDINRSMLVKRDPRLFLLQLELQDRLFTAFPHYYVSNNSKVVLTLIDYACNAAKSKLIDDRLRGEIQNLATKHIEKVEGVSSGSFRERIGQMKRTLTSEQ